MRGDNRMLPRESLLLSVHGNIQGYVCYDVPSCYRLWNALYRLPQTSLITWQILTKSSVLFIYWISYYTYNTQHSIELTTNTTRYIQR